VAAQQALQYAEQVKLAADAGSVLARRMQTAGNFSKLQRAREQAFAADALAQLARAQQAAQSTREALVRALGLNDTQARALTLPPRLPNLPATPLDGPPLTQAALDERIDLRLARAQLDFIAREQGVTRVASVVNAFDAGAVRHSETGLSPQRGFELQFPLPVFDFGDAARSRTQAATQAAVNRLAQLAVDAASQVRESHGAYLTSYGLARHYRDEVLPLRQTIAEENLLRYNGMLIGVFELLADSREQIAGVMDAIAAQRDFWLADAALQAALIGAPRTQSTESP
ncbi:MAG TPA: transporter, partial [Albitalea sp.]|nr:transporter [Albitalea sp.]